jgi:zinc transport system substrate-binding protein
MRTRVMLSGAAAVLMVVTSSACSKDKDPATGGDKKLNVVAGFYPLQFAAERIGGRRVAVTNLVQPGAEPHDLELKPSQIGQIASADLVIYLKTLQPELDKAVEQNNSAHGFDVASVSPLEHGAGAEEVGGLDPHLWLDPVRFGAVVDAVGARMAQADPAHAADYTNGARALRGELTTLDGEYSAGLKTCQRHEIVTSHAAFGYLAKRYGLQQIPITGLSPDEEPTPQHVAEVARKARELHATTIFFETLVSPKISETVAREIGAKTAVLDPIEGLEPGSGEDYLSVMRNNLKALRDALGCS